MSMTKKIELTNIDFKLLSVLRKRKQFIKSEIATELKIPWSTAYKSILRLTREGLLTEEYEENKYRATIAINSHKQLYVGICVGSSNLKLVIIGLDFEIIDLTVLSQNERDSLKEIFGSEDVRNNKCRWCMVTPNTRRKVSEILIEICNVVENMDYNIKAINFSFPGCIDFENQEIISTANLFPEEPIIHNADISLLITSSVKDNLENKGIKIYIDHNVKTSTIAEKEMLCMKEEKIKDMIVLYLGKGIGIGMVLNNQLVRSDKNAAGQYGHILMNNPKNGKLKELEDIIREDVFTGENMTSSGEKLREFIADSKNVENKELLINIIKLSLSNLIKILGVRNIIFSGKFDEILLEIEQDLAFSLAGVGENALHIRHSNYGEYSGAVGAAIGAYYNYYNIDYIWR